MSKSFLNQNHLPRGLRNNNPGNIRFSAGNQWTGKIPFDQNSDFSGNPSNVVRAFEQFIDIKHGLRAKMVLIYNYINSGDNTIAKIITRFAPPTENNTSGYIQTVRNLLGGVSATAVIDLNENNLVQLAKAINFVENGAAYDQYITDQDYWQAVAILDRPIKKKAEKAERVYKFCQH